jgi:hypothetical protein
MFPAAQYSELAVLSRILFTPLGILAVIKSAAVMVPWTGISTTTAGPTINSKGILSTVFPFPKK